MRRTPVLLSEASLAHDVDLRLERPSGALPPEVMRLVKEALIGVDINAVAPLSLRPSPSDPLHVTLTL